MSEHYDLIVIGAGSAARDGAGRAVQRYGARVALVERERWGGSCPNVACTPTKAYLVAAELLHDVNRLAREIGIDVGEARANLPAIYRRKESLKKPQAKWLSDLQASGFDTIEDEASLVDARTVRVGDRELTADRVLIATGSRTAVPPIEGIDDVDWIDHVSALELQELPESLLVVGGGAVGLEFGQAFARFGSQVTIVDALDQIAPRSDVQAAAELQKALEAEGVEVILSSFVKRVSGDTATIVPKDGGDAREVQASRIMLASGRLPNVEELGLDGVGIEVGKQGVVVDGHMRTSVAGIWAAGDVNGLAPLTPVAQYQARIAVDDMFGTATREADYSVLPTAIFTDPELAGVGLTEEAAKEQGLDFATAVHPLKPVRRASYLNIEHGLYKIVYDRGSRRVLGLHVVSRNAGDIVQGLAVAISLGATVDDLANAHHVFPTFGEGVKAAAEKAV